MFEPAYTFKYFLFFDFEHHPTIQQIQNFCIELFFDLHYDFLVVRTQYI